MLNVTPQEARRIWVEALRSGKYQQTQGRLARELEDGSIGYCCLGVACEVLGAEKGLTQDGRIMWLATGFVPAIHYLPDGIKILLGLKDKGGYHEGGSLVLTNDGGASFAEIADIIEAAPAGLFVETPDA